MPASASVHLLRESCAGPPARGMNGVVGPESPGHSHPWSLLWCMVSGRGAGGGLWSGAVLAPGSTAVNTPPGVICVTSALLLTCSVFWTFENTLNLGDNSGQE